MLMSLDSSISKDYNQISKMILMPNEHYQIIHEKLSYFKTNGDLLDYGCGNGLLIQFLKNDYNCEGYDFANKLIENAKSLNKKTVFYNNKNQIKKKYDIIILSEVIEHFVDPLTELNFIASLLNKNGIILVTTPNFNRVEIGEILIKKKRFQPIDDLLYSPQELNFLFKLINFRIVYFYNFGNYLPYYEETSYIKKIYLKIINKFFSFLNLNYMQKKNNLYIFKFDESLNFLKGFKALLDK